MKNTFTFVPIWLSINTWKPTSKSIVSKAYLKGGSDRGNDLIDVLRRRPRLRPHGQQDEVETEDRHQHEGRPRRLHRRGLRVVAARRRSCGRSRVAEGKIGTKLYFEI